MCTKKLECSMIIGTYYTTNHVKLQLFMPYYSSIKKSIHNCQVDNNCVDLDIGYYMNIRKHLRVKLGLVLGLKSYVKIG